MVVLNIMATNAGVTPIIKLQKGSTSEENTEGEPNSDHDNDGIEELSTNLTPLRARNPYLQQVSHGSSGYSSHIGSTGGSQDDAARVARHGSNSSFQDDPSVHQPHNGNPQIQGYLLSFDEWAQTETSIPYAGLSYMSQSKNFAVGYFDESGGYLNLPRYGISMFVPPGAVPSGNLDKLYLFVEVQSPTKVCPVEGAQWQPRVLHCGPPRYHFQNDIVLTLPHVRDHQHPYCQIGACCSDSDRAMDDWKDLNSPRDALVTFQDGFVSIMVDHFSKYATFEFVKPGCEDIMASTLNAGVFMRQVPTENHSSCVQLHVVLWNSVKENQVCVLLASSCICLLITYHVYRSTYGKNEYSHSEVFGSTLVSSCNKTLQYSPKKNRK